MNLKVVVVQRNGASFATLRHDIILADIGEDAGAEKGGDRRPGDRGPEAGREVV